MSGHVYLAGQIVGLTYKEATGWRNVAASLLKDKGIACRSPMRGKEALATAMRPIRASEPDIDPLFCNAQAIVTRDRNDCMTASCVLVRFPPGDNIPIGTLIELGWADARMIPIVAYYSGINTRLRDHPFIDQIVSFHTQELTEAVCAVASIMGCEGGGE